MIRETLRDDSQTRIAKTKQKNSDECKGMVLVPWNFDPLLYKCPFLVEFLWFVVNSLWNLSVPLFLCAKVDFGCSWFVVQNWEIPSENGNLLFGFDKLNSKIMLSLSTELIERSVLLIVICSDSWIVFVFISPLVPLSPLVGLRPPSKIPSFCHSASLCLLYLSLFYPRHNSRRRSLLMLVLALWLSLPQKAYGRVRVPRNLDSSFFLCPVLDSFLSTSSSFCRGRCLANWRIPPQNGHLFDKLKWIILLSMI